MLAFWEIHKKIVKTNKTCRVFPGRVLGVDLGSISMDFGTILGAFGCPKSEKGDPETLTVNDGQKVTQDFPGNSDTGGGLQN